MGLYKEAIIHCMEDGVVPVDPHRVASWADRLGEDADILSGMPMQHRIDLRGQAVDMDVIPVSVAEQVSAALPDTFDCLGWMIECYRETCG